MKRHAKVSDELAKAQSLARQGKAHVTVHYMLDWEMKRSVLQTHPMYESHTSTHLTEELTNAVNTWKLGKPYTLLPVTTDNVVNIVNAVHEANGLGPQISCFAHVVNITAKKAVSTWCPTSWGGSKKK